MSVTVDCGEGKHDLCSGRGRTAYLFPQESPEPDEPSFYCGCPCHHNETSSVPCMDPGCSEPKKILSQLTVDSVIQQTRTIPLPLGSSLIRKEEA